MTAFFRTAAITVCLAGLVLFGFWRLMLDERQKAIDELRELTQQLEQQLVQRQAMIKRLSRTHRIAHMRVLDQKTDTEGQVLETTLLLIELNDNGAELARQQFTVPGQVVFIDAWTVKFDHEHIAGGDPLRGRSLVLLRRVFSDQLAPRDGLPIDTPGAIPPGYAASDMGRFEQQVWENFWNIASDAAVAQRMGVRVAQGEAIYKLVRTGQVYELIADAAGGISLKPLAEEDKANLAASHTDQAALTQAAPTP